VYNVPGRSVCHSTGGRRAGESRPPWLPQSRAERPFIPLLVWNSKTSFSFHNGPQTTRGTVLGCDLCNTRVVNFTPKDVSVLTRIQDCVRSFSPAYHLGSNPHFWTENYENHLLFWFFFFFSYFLTAWCTVPPPEVAILRLPSRLVDRHTGLPGGWG
jgi:hypothetical protein